MCVFQQEGDAFRLVVGLFFDSSLFCFSGSDCERCPAGPGCCVTADTAAQRDPECLEGWLVGSASDWWEPLRRRIAACGAGHRSAFLL